MAVVVRKPGSTNWSDTTYWIGGALPDGATTDTIIIDNLSDDIAGVDESDEDGMTLYTGPNFTGSLGTPSTPMKFGSSMVFKINSPRAKQICLWPVAATSVNIEGCGFQKYGVYFYDGNLTVVNISGGGYIVLGALTNPTTIQMVVPGGSVAGARLEIESGATITTVTQSGGTILNYAAMTTVNLERGEFHHLGDTTGAITTVNQHAGLFNFQAATSGSASGFTIGTANVYGGLFDASRDARPRIVTAANLYAGGQIRAAASATVTTLNEYVTGAYFGPAPGTRNTYLGISGSASGSGSGI